MLKSCLRKDPTRRIQHMDDLRGRLQDLIEELGADAKDKSNEEKPKSRRAWAAGLLGVAAFAAWGAYRIVSPTASPPLKAVPFATDPGWEAIPASLLRVTALLTRGTARNRTTMTSTSSRATKVGRSASPTIPRRTSAPRGRRTARRLPSCARTGTVSTSITIPAFGKAPEKKLAELSRDAPYRGYPNREIAWSPDSDHLAFFDKPADGQAGLYLLNVTTRSSHRLTACPPARLREGDPAFSPDGRTLAFTRWSAYSVGDLYLLSLTPDLRPVGEPHRLAVGAQFQAVSQPAWTPDGRDIFFMGRDSIFSPEWVVWRKHVRTGSGEAERLPFTGEQLDVCRRGQRLIYNAPSPETNIWRLELESDTMVSAPIRFISSALTDTNPEYSPDGKQIAFASNRQGPWEIWLAANAAGSTPVKLTSLGAGGESGSPRWFPDSQTIVFDSDKEGQSDIYSVKTDGSGLKRLTNGGGTNVTPMVSVDGETIYFSSRREGTSQIWRMQSGGGPAEQVTRNGGFSPYVAPTGDFLYYQKDEALFSELWRVPVKGGEERVILPSVGCRRFVVRRDGIYFIAWEGYRAPSLEFYRFATRKTKKIADIEGPFLLYDIGLTMSPDSRSVLYTHPARPNSSLMLVENLR